MENMIKKKKGFTLIELIVVIAVIGILVLLAAPKFLGYTKDAKETQMKSDINAVSKIVASEMLEAEAAGIDYLSQLDKVSLDNIEEYTSSGQLFDKNGEANVITETPFYKVKDESVRAAGGKLSGDFIIDGEGETYYVNEAHSNNENNTDEDIYLATDEDFEWEPSPFGYYVDGESNQGYYKYTGDKKEIEIPHEINGHKMTSYFRMFFLEGEDVTKIVSTNKNISDMSEMFIGTQAASLDLSNFDTTNVTNMKSMFQESEMTHLDLSNWNTGKVETMREMFSFSPAQKIVMVQGFDTSNVTDMSSMFDNSQATELNLSSWDTSKVEDMASMFMNSQANPLTFGDKFNTSKVTDMSWMFRSSQAESLDLSNFNTSEVVNMAAMFTSSQASSLDLSNFNTSKVEKMNDMFYGSEAISLNLTNWDTNSVEDMNYMFTNSNVTSLDLSSFNTSNVSMIDMFDRASVIEGLAKTESDAERFNSEFGEPDISVFKVKK